MAPSTASERVSSITTSKADETVSLAPRAAGELLPSDNVR